MNSGIDLLEPQVASLISESFVDTEPVLVYLFCLPDAGLDLVVMEAKSFLIGGLLDFGLCLFYYL